MREILSIAAGGWLNTEPSFRQVKKIRTVTGAKQLPSEALDALPDVICTVLCKLCAPITIVPGISGLAKGDVPVIPLAATGTIEVDPMETCQKSKVLSPWLYHW